MNLVFIKGEDNNINVKIKINGVAEEFSYQKFIEQLVKKQILEPSEYGAGIDQSDKEKIDIMVSEVVQTTKTNILTASQTESQPEKLEVTPLS